MIASHNRKKAGEMVDILSHRFPGLEILTLADYESAPEPDEVGTTYAENAAIKALSAAVNTHEWSLADDAGLEIDALQGAPGLYSKRFGGEALPFPEKIARILELLRDVPAEARRARFRCCVALAAPDAEVVTASPPTIFEATCEGAIAEHPSGAGGFGYDPIFLPDDGFGRTMADLSAAEKHHISHRGKVLRVLGDFIEPCVSL